MGGDQNGYFFEIGIFIFHWLYIWVADRGNIQAFLLKKQHREKMDKSGIFARSLASLIRLWIMSFVHHIGAWELFCHQRFACEGELISFNGGVYDRYWIYFRCFFLKAFKCQIMGLFRWMGKPSRSDLSEIFIFLVNTWHDILFFHSPLCRLRRWEIIAASDIYRSSRNVLFNLCCGYYFIIKIRTQNGSSHKNVRWPVYNFSVELFSQNDLYFG